MSATLEYTAPLVAAIADSANDFAAWREQGRALAQAHKGHQFEIGDWIVDGIERWGPKKAYKEARAIFPGYRHSTLKLYAHVARNVPALVRTNDLPWEHHQLVARFKPELQQELLAYALKINKIPNCNMTADCFRKHINQQYPAKKERKPSSAIPIMLPPDVLADVALIAKTNEQRVDETVCYLVELALRMPKVADYLTQARKQEAA